MRRELSYDFHIADHLDALCLKIRNRALIQVCAQLCTAVCTPPPPCENHEWLQAQALVLVLHAQHASSFSLPFVDLSLHVSTAFSTLVRTGRPQYMGPYVKLDLRTMATAFNTDLASIEEEAKQKTRHPPYSPAAPPVSTEPGGLMGHRGSFLLASRWPSSS